MTKSKKLFVTALVALSVFGALLAASLYSETVKMSVLGFFAAVGYALTVYAFYGFLGDGKTEEPAPKKKAQKLEKAYDYAADETTRDIGRTVDEIMAEVLAENGQKK